MRSRAEDEGNHNTLSFMKDRIGEREGFLWRDLDELTSLVGDQRLDFSYQRITVFLVRCGGEHESCFVVAPSLLARNVLDIFSHQE